MTLTLTFVLLLISRLVVFSYSTDSATTDTLSSTTDLKDSSNVTTAGTSENTTNEAKSTASTTDTIISTKDSTKSTEFSNTEPVGSSTTPLYPSCSTVTGNVVNSNFQLTVSPDALSGNTNYTVKVNGSGHATIILQAKSGTSFVGNWSDGHYTCSGGSPLFEILFDTNNAPLVAYWRSPSNPNPVEISAIITVNDTFNLTKQLTAATTKAPPVTTKNAGSANRPNSACMDLTKVLIMIIITTKLLS